MVAKTQCANPIRSYAPIGALQALCLGRFNTSVLVGA